MKTLLFTVLFASSFCSFAQTKSSTGVIKKSGELLDKKDYEGSVRVLTTAINDMPDSADLYIARAGIVAKFGMFKEAINDFEMAIIKNTNNARRSNLYASLGSLKAKTRDFNGGYQDCLYATELDSLNVNAWNNLAVVADEAGHSDKTLSYLEKALKLAPTNIGSHVNLGFKYQNLKQYEKSLEYFNKAIELDPRQPLIYSNRSYSLLKLNDLTGAMADINKSIEMYPTNSWAFRNRALIYIEKKDLKLACKDLDEAIELGFTAMYGNEVVLLKDQTCK
jgi:tetratricopeptide (TPR) repeat protein